MLQENTQSYKTDKIRLSNIIGDQSYFFIKKPKTWSKKVKDYSG